MRQYKKTCIKGVASGLLLASTAMSVMAGGVIELDDDRWISVGVGLRAGYNMTEKSSLDGNHYSKNFSVQSARLYISGQAAEDWKFTLNFDEIFGHTGVLDAMIQYEPSDYLNVWAGRVLVPADRIEMNGPFYGLSWNQYTVPLFHSDNDPAGTAGLYGRDEGIVFWGSIAKFQYAFGAFDGLTKKSNNADTLLYAMRLAYNIFNMEQNPGYYTSSTYYGGLGNILTVGLSVQHQVNGTGSIPDDAEDFTGYALDLLYEQVLGGGSVITMEAEYKIFKTDYKPTGADTEFAMFDGESSFVTVAYLFPNEMGPGKLQPYVRMTATTPNEGDESNLMELGLNYVISGHNLRLNANVTTGDANPSGMKSENDVMTIAFGFQLQI